MKLYLFVVYLKRKPHTLLGATVLCVYAIIPYNIIIIYSRVLAKFSFRTIASYSILGISLYLFYRKKGCCSIQKKKEKSDRSPYSFTRK